MGLQPTYSTRYKNSEIQTEIVQGHQAEALKYEVRHAQTESEVRYLLGCGGFRT